MPFSPMHPYLPVHHRYISTCALSSFFFFNLQKRFFHFCITLFSNYSHVVVCMCVSMNHNHNMYNKGRQFLCSKLCWKSRILEGFDPPLYFSASFFWTYFFKYALLLCLFPRTITHNTHTEIGIPTFFFSLSLFTFLLNMYKMMCNTQ
jgi:hypothetical protein